LTRSADAATFFRLSPLTPRSSLFPYTTLFRSSTTVCRWANLAGPLGSIRRPYRSPWHGERNGWIREGSRSSVQERTRHKTKARRDRKSTRLNSSHGSISYAVFCLKKKNKFNDL